MGCKRTVSLTQPNRSGSSDNLQSLARNKTVLVVSKGQGLGSDETVCASYSCSICWRSSKVIDFWLTRISPNGRDLSKSQPLKAFNTISRFKKPSSKPKSANILFRRISWIEEVAFDLMAYPRSQWGVVTFHRTGYLGKNRREVHVIEGRFS